MSIQTECDWIRVLNDNFRSTFIGGQVVLTSGVSELPIDVKAEALLLVKTLTTSPKTMSRTASMTSALRSRRRDVLLESRLLRCSTVGRAPKTQQTRKDEARAHDHVRRGIFSMRPTGKCIYMLADYTVEWKRDGWYSAARAVRGQGRVKGPDTKASLPVTLVIARNLKREITRRDALRAQRRQRRLNHCHRGQRYLWKEILNRRREQRKAARQPQLPCSS